MSATWHSPRRGTAAHHVRTAVRYVLWSSLALAAIVLADPYGRAAILGW